MPWLLRRKPRAERNGDISVTMGSGDSDNDYGTGEWGDNPRRLSGHRLTHTHTHTQPPMNAL